MRRFSASRFLAASAAVAGIALMTSLAGCGGGGGGGNPQPPPPEPQVSAAKSTITAAPTTVTADGKAAAVITVALKDTEGNSFTGTASVNISADPCTRCTLHYSNDNGQVTGSLTSAVAEDIVLSFTVNNTKSPNTATVHFVAVPPPATHSLAGVVVSGSRPLAGSTVKVWAANPTPHAPAILLGTGRTDQSGEFKVGFDPVPRAGQILYAVATGGDAGAGANSAIRFATVAGPFCSGDGCRFPDRVTINPLASVAMAYSLEGYTDLSSGGVNISGPSSGPGLANAAATFATLANAASGEAAVAGASTTLCVGGKDEPDNCDAVRKLDTLADFVAACADSSGPGSPACSGLLGGAASAPDTFAALFNIATRSGLRSDGAGVFALVPTPATAYAPALVAAPNDWSLALVYAGGGLYQPMGVAVDGAGNVWVANYKPGNNKGAHDGSISKFAPDGTALSPAAGFTGGGLLGSWGIAIDADGNAWVGNWNGGDGTIVSEIAPDGTPVAADGYTISGTSPGPMAVTVAPDGTVWVGNFGNSTLTHLGPSGAEIGQYAGGGLALPVAVAVDALGDVWLANSANSTVSEFTGAGHALSPASGYTGGGLSTPDGMALDADGNVWIANFFGPNYPPDSTVTQLVGGNTPPPSCPAQPGIGDTGCALSPADGFQGGGLDAGNFVAVDSAGHVFVSNYHGNSLSELSAADGNPLSPADGYRAPAISLPSGIAIDAAGNLWMANFGNDRIVKFIGIAAPVKMPLSGLPATP